MKRRPGEILGNQVGWPIHTCFGSCAGMCITTSSDKTQNLENLNSVVRRIAHIYETVFVDDDAVKVTELARPVSGTAPHELEIEFFVEDLDAVVAHVGNVEITELVKRNSGRMPEAFGLPSRATNGANEPPLRRKDLDSVIA